MYNSRDIISMKTLMIAALFVASVLLIGVTAATSPAYAEVNWNRDNPERFDGEFSFSELFFEFSWWGVEESKIEP